MRVTKKMTFKIKIQNPVTLTGRISRELLGMILSMLKRQLFNLFDSLSLFKKCIFIKVKNVAKYEFLL